jgi:DNA-directed RNA polymerase subunit RPC12/RpoP
MSMKEPVRCPKCASTDVRYSYTQTTWDLILDLLFSMDAFRCRSCRHRFHKFDPGDDAAETENAIQETKSVKPAQQHE